MFVPWPITRTAMETVMPLHPAEDMYGYVAVLVRVLYDLHIAG